ncbi:translation initiation factor IF-3 [Candidatus Endolissoclinum faulkneri]|nr:translation initiation factor IF-3 [Candidatus Endolissoclinum faulkneri]
MTQSKKNGPRVNRDIRVPKVRCVGPDGDILGLMSVDEAIEQAEKFGLDLVEVSPNADPPVCKILGYGKFKYEAQKKSNEAKKKQKVIEIKEIKMRPNINEHDYQTKMRSVIRFLTGGDKVKLTMRFRGREMAHQEIGLNVLKRVQEDMADITKVESYPKLEGKQMIMVITPR